MYDEFDRAAAGRATPSAPARIFNDMKDALPARRVHRPGGPRRRQARRREGPGRRGPGRPRLGRRQRLPRASTGRSPRLRLAGLLLDEKKYDEALKQLDGVDGGEFQALAADRRGDVLMAQGKAEEAKAAYAKAWAAMDAKVDYRRVVEAKLNVLGVDPAASAAFTAARSARSMRRWAASSSIRACSTSCSPERTRSRSPPRAVRRAVRTRQTDQGPSGAPSRRTCEVNAEVHRRAGSRRRLPITHGEAPHEPGSACGRKRLARRRCASA